MSTEDNNKAIVGRWFSEFWGADFNPTVIDELAVPDIRFEYSLHAPCRGRDEVRAFATRFAVSTASKTPSRGNGMQTSALHAPSGLIAQPGRRRTCRRRCRDGRGSCCKLLRFAPLSPSEWMRGSARAESDGADGVACGQASIGG
jgi:hypothetical protein